jgi:hypothetical protein
MGGLQRKTSSFPDAEPGFNAPTLGIVSDSILRRIMRDNN